MGHKAFFKLRGITATILSWTLMVSLVPLLIISLVSDLKARTVLKTEIFRSLDAISDRQANFIEDYGKERLKDLEAFSKLPSLPQTVKDFERAFNQGINSPEYASVERERSFFFEEYKNIFQYHDIFLIDLHGNIIFTVAGEEDLGENLETGSLKDTGLARAFRRARDLEPPRITEMEDYAPSEEKAVFLAAPVFESQKRKKIVGICAFQLTNKEINSVVNDYLGLGETGETVVAQRSGDEFVFLTSLRHDPDAALKRRGRIGGEAAVPMQKAIAGGSGTGAMVDYRGEEVLAVWHYLPVWRWGMVVKIDESEAFAPLRGFEGFLFAALLLVVAGIIIVAVLSARFFSRPILEMTAMTRRISDGDLQLRVSEEGENEITDLARAFNKMAANLLEAFQKRDDEITARKKAEANLRRLATVVLDSNDAITVQDLDGKITAWNRGAEQMYGWSEADALKMNIRDIVSEDKKEEALRFVKSAAAAAAAVTSLETQRVTKDGKILDVWLVVTKLIDETGKVVAIATTERDITARKKAEVEIKKYSAQLLAVNKELESFSYSVSHDLRAPLRAMDGFSKILLEDYPGKLDNAGKGYLNRISAASQRMGQLIDDLLGLSRVIRRELEIGSVDLSGMGRQIANELQSSEPERHVEFVIQAKMVAVGDEHLLWNLLQNLLGNAWKFSSRIPSAKIEFGVTVKDGEEVYFVRDNGAGFDMAYADKLFGSFQRLHSEEEFPGTGIGLATAQRVLNRHGGRIWADAKVNEGATFYFTL